MTHKDKRCKDNGLRAMEVGRREKGGKNKMLSDRELQKSYKKKVIFLVFSLVRMKESASFAVVLSK